MKKLIFLTLIILTSCQTYKPLPLGYSDELTPPPGTAEIGENLYFDITEVTNFHWLEYSSWLQEIYGKDSDEFRSSIPNKDINSPLNEQYSDFNKNHLRHPAYRDYPVIGISYQQAKDYSKWRSDRVFQYNLIKQKIISYPFPKHKDSIFTIEKYFSGEFMNYKPSEEVKFYPEYSLPDSVTYIQFSQFADSVNTAFMESRKGRKLSGKLEDNCAGNKTDTHPAGPRPAINPIYSNKKLIISHLHGNVREMTNIEGEFYGLSYTDSCNVEYNKIRKDDNLVNGFTGFRNVCVYKKWKDSFE